MRTPVLLTKGGSDTDDINYATASISPSAGSTILACFAVLDLGAALIADPAPTVTGCGLTWQNVTSVAGTTVQPIMHVYSASSASTPTPGAVTISGVVTSGQTADGAAWMIVEIPNTDIYSGSVPNINGVVQSDVNGVTTDDFTAGGLALGAFRDAASGSVFFMCAYDTGGGTLNNTAGGSFTELSEQDQAAGGDSLCLSFMYATGNVTTAVGSTSTANDRLLGIMMEIAQVRPIPGTESDTAVAVTQAKHVTITPATETDQAVHPITVTVTPAAETDTAVAVTFTQGGANDYDIVAAVETDTGVTLDVDKQASVTATTETDTAQPVTPAKQISVTSALETDAAVAVTEAKRVTVTAATEADTAVAASITKTIYVTVTPAAESDTAVTVSAAKQITVTSASESDTPVTVTYSQAHTVTITPAVETDTATQATATKHATLTPAGEADTPVAVTVTKQASITFAAESDVAVPVTIAGQPQHVDITAGLEADTAVAASITHPISVTIIPATETDIAAQATTAKHATLVPVSEVSSAVAITVAHIEPIIPATETDTAVPPVIAGVVNYVDITAATEADVAVLMTNTAADPHQLAIRRFVALIGSGPGRREVFVDSPAPHLEQTDEPFLVGHEPISP